MANLPVSLKEKSKRISGNSLGSLWGKAQNKDISIAHAQTILTGVGF